jgi:hypothetical protein
MINFINLLILFFLGIIYLFFFAKVQKLYFHRFGDSDRPLAVTILLLASVIAASVNLFHIAEQTADANRFFLSAADYLNSALYSLAYFTGMWLFSLGLFHVSFLITGMLTTESEKDELSKNNIEVALLHSIILISLSFIIAPALTKIASSFIPYPELPF